ncbi:MAG TPA: tetratricopeptide repeat protein, partial [Chitinophagaceae bacterium]|nr:tetratricopeptide repeat protein [Chitinophagaceae bacterium]
IYKPPISFPALLAAILLAGCHTGGKKEPAAAQQEPNTGITDTTAAIRNLEASFSQHPGIYKGLELANLYAETKNPKAIGLCDALLAKDTARELTDAVFIKGTYYANTGDTAAAMQLFGECINRDWKFIEAYIEKGILQYEQRHFTGAAKTFELAVKVANTYPDAYYWLGKCREAMGQKEEALDNYSRALALDKEFKEAEEGIKRLSLR